MPWTTELPSYTVFFAAALLVPFVGRRLRQIVLLLAPVLGAVQFVTAGSDVALDAVLMGLQVTPVRVDALSLAFGYVFHLAAFIGIVFSLHVVDNRQHVGALVYIGSALGALFAGDLLTLFIFWELMTVSSALLIFARDTDRARRAAMRYLVVQVTSGVLLLGGAVLWYRQTGSMAFTYVGLEGAAGALLLLAFGIKSAFPLFHTWLTDAYPESTPTGMVFLSAFSTKVAVYTLVRGFPGTELLIYTGAVMAVFPVLYAVIENDLRRVLAYSMVNQIGYMVVGVGIGTPLALAGTVAHVATHVVYKALLLMAMGSVLQMTGRIHASDLGGLHRSMPWTAAFCIVGAASIAALPLFGGFISKSMIMSATLYGGHTVVWFMLLFAAAGVVYKAAIKVPYFAFFGRDSGLAPGDPPLNMRVAMGIAAAACIVFGTFPSVVYDLLPFDADYQPYTAGHVLTQLQLLAFAAAGFIWLRLSGAYPPELHATNLDADWLYRLWAARGLARAGAAIRVLDRAARDAFLAQLHKVLHHLRRHHGPEGRLARTWPTGSMALWVAVMLAATLVMYYV